MNHRIALACAAALGLATLPGASFATTTFGSNLIVNGNAEADPGSTDGGEIGAVTGFGRSGQFTVVQYDASGGFPTSSDPGPASRGKNFFGGGPSAALSTGTQTLHLTDIALSIDGGQAGYDLSAWLGGYSTQDDNAILSIAFLDIDNAQLGSASVGPVTEPDRSGLTGLLYRDVLGLVPARTRSIDVTLTLTREQGSYDDGYADNLARVLTGGAVPAVPEPDNAALLEAAPQAVSTARMRMVRPPPRAWRGPGGPDGGQRRRSSQSRHHRVISVPEPRSVRSSISTAWGTLPSRMTTPSTPRSSA